MFDDFDTQVQCEELYDFVPNDDDYMEDGIDIRLDDEDGDTLLDADGGVTGAGMELLACMEARGDFAS